MSRTKHIFCPSCGTKLTVPAALPPGRKLKCGKCQQVFASPKPAAAHQAARRAASAPPVGRPGLLKEPPTPEIVDEVTIMGPAPRRKPRPPTAVGQFSLDDLPDDLRAIIDGYSGSDSPVRRPTDPEQMIGKPKRPMSADTAERKAFNLDTKGRPKRRTGVGMIDIAHLRELAEAGLVGEEEETDAPE